MFSRNNPLRTLERRTVSLKNSIDNVVSTLRREQIKPDRILLPLLGRDSAFASLWSSVRKEARAWPVYHAISLTGFDGISNSFSDFAADLESVNRKLSATNTQQTKGMLSAVHRDTRKLGTAIKRLDEDVRRQRVWVVQSHQGNIQEFVKIRAAVATIDKNAAKDLDGEEVDYFCDWPAVDLDDAEQVERIAKLIILNRDPHQQYELRCRIAKPGRPLMQGRCEAFPSVAEVEAFALYWNTPKKILVAAKKPSWRVVWVFELGNRGWYW